MFLKLICLTFIITTYAELSDSTENAALNGTNENPSQLSETEPDLIRQLNEETDLLSINFYGRNCAEATASTKSSGIYEILIPSYSKEPFRVFCDADTQGGGWTVILRRLDGSENFNRNWNTYKKGFGSVNAELFLGLDKIHALTNDYSQELLVVLEDFDGVEAYETYDRFGIADEDEQYALQTLGKHSGTAGESLLYHKTMKFSTYDRDNDLWKEGSCSLQNNGAWWYNLCLHSNLAGTYNSTVYASGVNWNTFRGVKYSLKRAIMMIRPTK